MFATFNSTSKGIFIGLLLLSLNSKGQTNTNSDSVQLSNALTEAQIKNQLAQAEFYAQKPHALNDQWISVLGVLIAGLVSFVSAVILSTKTIRNEREKNEHSQKEQYRNDTREAAGKLIEKTAKAFHYMTWMLWIAKHTPALFEEKNIQDYDQVMNKLYAEIAGAQVILASYSKKLYDDTEGFVLKLYKYDGDIGRIAAKLSGANKAHAIDELGTYWRQVFDFSKLIPKEFSSKLESHFSS